MRSGTTRCADAIYLNARIVTFDSKVRTADSLAVEGGRIVALGETRRVKGIAPRGCEKFDLGGMTMVPGFIDGHTHFVQMGVDSLRTDLSGARSLEDALRLMKDSAKSTPEGQWVIGTSWKESAWPDSRFITRKDLDRCCPNHPAAAFRVCMHMCSVNTPAIDLLDLDGKDPGVDRDSTGRITGILKEGAMEPVYAATRPDERTRRTGLIRAMKKARSLGVTSIHDNGSSSDIKTYCDAERDGTLSIRVWFNVPVSDVDSAIRLSLPSGIGSEWFRIGGVKMFCDGALGARSAAVSKSYADARSNKGMFVYKRREFMETVSKVHNSGMQLAIHAIGDAGIGRALEAIEAALSDLPRRDHRHRIEHLELPSPGHLRRMSDSAILASMQPNFVGEWGGTEGMYVSRLGYSRAARNNPFREVLDARVRLVFGSDCMPFSPTYGIHSAVNAPFPSQRITPAESMAAYSRGGAYACFAERDKGTLSVGKYADFVVLDADPFSRPSEISGIKVKMTVVGGEPVFSRLHADRY